MTQLQTNIMPSLPNINTNDLVADNYNLLNYLMNPTPGNQFNVNVNNDSMYSPSASSAFYGQQQIVNILTSIQQALQGMTIINCTLVWYLE